MELKERYQLADILSKHFTNSLTDSEQLMLDAWLNESVKNRDLFNEFNRSGFFEEKRFVEASVDTEAAMLEFLERTRRSSKRQSLFSRYFKYTAAAAVLMIIGAFVFVLSHKHGIEPQSLIALKEEITPGSKNAILTLANGKKVYLNNSVTGTINDQSSSVIKATDSSLHYQDFHKSQVLTYNELETPNKSEFTIILSDGTKVWLNSGSKIKYPVTFVANERRVQLSGEAYFEVTKDKKKPFIIEVADNSIQVLGTSFNVKAYSNDPVIHTTLIEGAVRMITPAQFMDLKPNEQGVINLKTSQITKSVVDVNLYVGWKNGRFIFDNQPLEEIMNAISRWYGIDVVFDNQEARKVTFSGNLKRYESLNKIITMLEMTEQIKFKKEGRTIHITK